VWLTNRINNNRHNKKGDVMGATKKGWFVKVSKTLTEASGIDLEVVWAVNQAAIDTGESGIAARSPSSISPMT